MKRLLLFLICSVLLTTFCTIHIMAAEKSDAQKTIKKLTNAAKGIDTETETETEDQSEHIDFEIHDETFSSELSLSFAVYEAFQQAGRELGYVTQHHNPELKFDPDTQTVDSIHFYLDYYGQCTKEEAVKILEAYTDELIYVINNAFPNVDFEFVGINWKIPAVDEESYYAATYYCNKEDGRIVRGDGGGLIYQ